MWVLPLRSNPLAFGLFCFPYAGGSAAVFRSWPAALPGVDVRAVQLPGRGGRIREKPHTSVRDAAKAACDGLLPHLAEAPFGLFGHSFGALVAFEVARELRRRGGPQPAHLFVSARRGPRSPDRHAPLHGLPDPRFVDEVRARYGGIPDAVLNEPELLALLLPMLRSDLEAVETYSYAPEAPLEVPITALGGMSDPWATLDDLMAWRDETTASFSVTRFPGGHFYLDESAPALLTEVRSQLGRLSASSAIAVALP
jgi:medium-chain acyl-[acyl-carrier-protein] hydrolase